MKNISCLTRVRPSINRRKKFNLIPRMVKNKKKKKKKKNAMVGVYVGVICGDALALLIFIIKWLLGVIKLLSASFISKKLQKLK